MTVLELEQQEIFDLLPEPETEHLGPVWDLNPEWDGVSLTGPYAKYMLPKHTLGDHVWAWVRDNTLAPDASEYHPEPFVPTYEQWRFVMWWYAVDERGRWIFRRGVFQRLKGHGKDPIASVISGVELLGPCRFRGWATEDMPSIGVKFNEPVGEDNPNAWIQIAAVSKTQTQNTMLLFHSLFTADCLAKAHMRADSIGITKVTAYRGKRQIQAVTKNPATLEGARPSLVIKNETEHWVESNKGWEMDAVIDRNAAKSKGGAARVLSICNAPEPSEESVGRRERDAYVAETEGRAFKTGVLYDSLELAEKVPLFPPILDHMDTDDQEPILVAYLMRCIKAVKGDSWWLDEERIAYEILDAKNPTSQSRRFYFNQAIAAEDAWAPPRFVDAMIDPLVGVLRIEGCDQIRIGWEIVHPTEPIVMFFDGSKSDDATVLIGCRLSDGYCFTIGIWQAPPARRRRGSASWLAPRGEVDSRVDEAFERFDVVAFFGDPSHAKDDESGSSYWDATMDEWHKRYKDQLQLWSIKTGADQHSIMWDMSSPARTKQFVEAAERTREEIQILDADGMPTPAFTIDGHPRLLEHIKNAKEAPGRFGVSVRKIGRESPRKIDGCVGVIGARMLRRIVLNSEDNQSKGGWGMAV